MQRGKLPALAACLACLAWLAVSGCLSSNPSAAPRFFRLELPPVAAPETRPAEPTVLRLRTVRAADCLREMVVWRSSEVECGFYDLVRWAELPVVFLERALVRRLFETGALRRAEGAEGYVLDVELLAFEEVLAPEHGALVELRVSLADAKSGVIHDWTVRTWRPLTESGPDAMARKMGLALQDAVAELGAKVEHLGRR